MGKPSIPNQPTQGNPLGAAQFNPFQGWTPTSTNPNVRDDAYYDDQYQIIRRMFLGIAGKDPNTTPIESPRNRLLGGKPTEGRQGLMAAHQRAYQKQQEQLNKPVNPMQPNPVAIPGPVTPALPLDPLSRPYR